MAKTGSIGKLISILHRKSRVYFERELEPMGIGSGEVKIFSYLAHEPGATQQEITEYFKLDKGTVSYLIKKWTGAATSARTLILRIADHISYT